MEILLIGIIVMIAIIGARFDIQSSRMIKLMERYLQLEEDYADKIEKEDNEWNDMIKQEANDINTICNLLINYAGELEKNKSNNVNKEK